MLNGIIAGIKIPFDYLLIQLQPYRHFAALKLLRKKERIRAVFFVSNADIWKYERVYFLLKEDTRLEPLVVVCPPTNLSDEQHIHDEMDKSYEYFSQNNYDVIKSYNDNDGTYLDVKKELAPDIVFFTNPYGYTLRKYQIKNYLNVLTCYVQYSFILEAKEHFYNKTFHSLLWKAFYETELHREQAKKFAKNRGSNVEITGHPVTDSFKFGERLNNSAWKNSNKDLKRIIWAPHWSVVERGEGRSLASNFFDLSDFMIHLAETYRDSLQIAFKPHPYLKSTLYKLEEWGKMRTDAYYGRWEKMENGQLETGNYIDLFNSSDAMILDSMSFIVEYLYCGKPSLFIKASDTVDKCFNNLGKKALEHHYHGKEKKDITTFIENVVINGCDRMKEKRDRFYCDVLVSPSGESASKNIYNLICREIF